MGGIYGLAPLNLRHKLLGVLAVPAFLAPFSLFGSEARAQQATTPATNSDIAIYQAMGTSFFCMAALDGVDFPKALGISASTYAQALKGRHGGKVAALKGKTLSDKEMFAAAEQQVRQYVAHAMLNERAQSVFAHVQRLFLLVLPGPCPFRSTVLDEG